MKASERRQLHILADAMADGTVTVQEAEQLTALLKDNPEAQDLYLDYLDVHANLSWMFRDGEPVILPETRRQGSASRTQARSQIGFSTSFWRISVVAMIAASVIGLMMLLWPSTSEQTTTTEEGDASPTFCRLTRSAGARWKADKEVKTGDRLGSQHVELEAGIVEMTFDNGVKAVLAGPADLELIDDMHTWLHRGRVVFHVPPSAIGFTLETTEANVMDLGTEFGVHTEESIGTEVQVYEGEVVAEFKTLAGSQQPSQRLQGGQALRIAPGEGEEPEELRFWPERFVRYLPDPNERHRQKPGESPYAPHNEPRFDEIHIVPAPTKMKIDGKLNEWDWSGHFLSHCEPPYDAFYHVDGAMMYDKNFLYIGAKVGDPFPMRSVVSPHEKRKLYGNGSCLAFRISTDRDMGWPVRGEGPGTHQVRKMRPKDFNEKLVFLVLWYYAPEKLPSLHVTYGMDWHGAQVNPNGYQGAFRKHKHGRGYTAEYAIPWSLLAAGNDPPCAGDVLGCTWLVHWAGPEGRNWKGQLVDIVNPAVTGWNFQNAGTWGRAIYHHKGNLPPGTVRPLRDVQKEE